MSARPQSSRSYSPPCAPQLALFLVNFSQLNPLPIPLYTLSAFDSEISLPVGRISVNLELLKPCLANLLTRTLGLRRNNSIEC